MHKIQLSRRELPGNKSPPRLTAQEASASARRLSGGSSLTGSYSDFTGSELSSWAPEGGVGLQRLHSSWPAGLEWAAGGVGGGGEPLRATCCANSTDGALSTGVSSGQESELEESDGEHLLLRFHRDRLGGLRRLSGVVSCCVDGKVRCGDGGDGGDETNMPSAINGAHNESITPQQVVARSEGRQLRWLGSRWSLRASASELALGRKFKLNHHHHHPAPCSSNHKIQHQPKARQNNHNNNSNNNDNNNNRCGHHGKCNTTDAYSSQSNVAARHVYNQFHTARLNSPSLFHGSSRLARLLVCRRVRRRHSRRRRRHRRPRVVHHKVTSLLLLKQQQFTRENVGQANFSSSLARRSELESESDWEWERESERERERESQCELANHSPRSCPTGASGSSLAQSSSSLNKTTTSARDSSSAESSCRFNQHPQRCHNLPSVSRKPESATPSPTPTSSSLQQQTGASASGENANLGNSRQSLDIRNLHSGKQDQELRRELGRDHNRDKHQQLASIDQKQLTGWKLSLASDHFLAYNGRQSFTFNSTPSLSSSGSCCSTATCSSSSSSSAPSASALSTSSLSSQESPDGEQAGEEPTSLEATNESRPLRSDSHARQLALAKEQLQEEKEEEEKFVEVDLSENGSEWRRFARANKASEAERASELPHEQVMEILRGQQPSAASKQQQPQNSADSNLYYQQLNNPPANKYPNNTLLVDLNKCHKKLTRLWPAPSCLARSWSALSRLLAKFRWRRRRSSSSSSSSASEASAASYQHFSPARLELDVEQLAGSAPGQMGAERNEKTVKLNYKFNMPESLLRTNIKIKLDDYDKALSVLTSDIRYQLHLLLYRRVQSIWLLLSTILCLAAPILTANLEFTLLVGVSLLWLTLQATGALVTSKFRQKLNLMLERSVAQANTFFMDHHLLLGVINEGGLFEKRKLMVPMLYFDTSQCREQIESIISADSRKNNAKCDTGNSIIDYSKNHSSLTKSTNSMALAQSQLAKKIVLRYSQRWISHFDKRLLVFADERSKPRHLSTGKCLCQFIEEHFERRNSRGKSNCGGPEQTSQQPADSLAVSCAGSVISEKLDRGFEGPSRRVVEAREQEQVIPTLSGLISSRDEQRRQLEESLLEVVIQNGNGLPDDRRVGPNQNGLLREVSEFAGQTTYNELLESERTNKNTSPNTLTSANGDYLSLELNLHGIDNGVPRSDHLIRKLRLLLEQRKNQLEGIEGSLFSSYLHKKHFHVIPDNESITSQHRKQSHANNIHSPVREIVGRKTKKSQQGKQNGRKKFYSQGESLLFLAGTRKKKHNHQELEQQHQSNHGNHVLEIC